MKGLKYLMVYSLFLVKILGDVLQQTGNKTKKEKNTRSRGDRGPERKSRSDS